MFQYSIEKKLRRLVEMAAKLGLRSQDRDNALNFLSHNEGGECFDTIAAQMYEYDIEIDNEFLRLAREIQKGMQIDEQEYSYLDELLMKGSYIDES
jgi:hypothetical protein